MRLRQIPILLFFISIANFTFTQIEQHKTMLLGTWVAQQSEDGVLFKKANEFEVENYGMTFFVDGTLTRRSAKGFFEVSWYDHPGTWRCSGDTLFLSYFFDEKQKAQEKVVIKQLDDQYLKFERLDWVEIRE